MIIGICGLIGSGKGSVADILVEEHNFKKISNYNPLRAISYIKSHKKELFWAWVSYQSLKGIVTLSFIWIPLWIYFKK